MLFFEHFIILDHLIFLVLMTHGITPQRAQMRENWQCSMLFAVCSMLYSDHVEYIHSHMMATEHPLLAW